MYHSQNTEPVWPDDIYAPALLAAMEEEFISWGHYGDLHLIAASKRNCCILIWLLTGTSIFTKYCHSVSKLKVN